MTVAENKAAISSFLEEVLNLQEEQIERVAAVIPTWSIRTTSGEASVAPEAWTRAVAKKATPQTKKMYYRLQPGGRTSASRRRRVQQGQRAYCRSLPVNPNVCVMMLKASF